jgi:dihydrodipicolinate synthase/N-acetylneuraminate lyase
MKTSAFDANDLPKSVIAVPPLARDAKGAVCAMENAKIIRHIESGGVRSLLYGGNAVFYHITLAEYDRTLGILADAAGPDTVVVPSVGPAYGFAIDQVNVLHNHQFPTVMLLPSRDVVDGAGIATGIRRIAERLGKPIVLYLKFDRWLDPKLIAALNADGVISWIKYAVVLKDPAEDDYLRDVIDVFPKTRIVSGIGEQPAIVHLRDFGITGFTSGCVCVQPAPSMKMLSSIQAGDFETAEKIRRYYLPLEDLRNEIHPIRVLHRAVELAGIAQTGAMPPMLSDIGAEDRDRIANAVKRMSAV